MRQFWTIVGFEYRKILGRRSTWAALTAVLIFALLNSQLYLMGGSYINGEYLESNRQAMEKDRGYALALSGRPMDGELLTEAARAYQAIPQDAELYQATQEYQQTARPYEPIWLMMSNFYTEEEVLAMTPDLAAEFYARRSALVAKDIAEMSAGDATKAALLAWDAQIKTPWTYRSTAGYETFLTALEFVGFLAAFAGAVCLAPLFAGEYSRGTDPILRSARHGRGLLAWAKLLAGTTVQLALFGLTAGASWLSFLFSYGFDNGDAPLQMMAWRYNYPLTLLQCTFLCVLCVMAASLMQAALTMLLSARLKTPFAVVIVVTVLMLAPMMFDLPKRPLWPLLLYNLLPVRMMKFSNIFSPAPYELPGAVVPQYVVFPAFALLAALALVFLAARCYRRRQVA